MRRCEKQERFGFEQFGSVLLNYPPNKYTPFICYFRGEPAERLCGYHAPSRVP
jgi:hypothetical protein